jgi:hypothetical protein
LVSKRHQAPRLIKRAETNEDENMSRTRLSNRERFAIEKFIEQNGIETDQGFWRYDHGVSDHSIAKQFETTGKTISNLRLKTFGLLEQHASRSKSTVVELTNRVDELEQRLTQLEDRYTQPKQETWLQKAGNGIAKESQNAAQS